MIMREKVMRRLSTCRFQYKSFYIQLALIGISVTAYFASIDESAVGSDQSHVKVFFQFFGKQRFEIFYSVFGIS